MRGSGLAGLHPCGTPHSGTPLTGAASHGPPLIQSPRPLSQRPCGYWPPLSQRRDGVTAAVGSAQGPSIVLVETALAPPGFCLPMCTGTSLSAPWGKSVLPAAGAVLSLKMMPRTATPTVWSLQGLHRLVFTSALSFLA